jgi:hypothetical protein
MKMNPMVGLFLSSSVYLFVIGITIWALTAPYMNARVSGMQLDMYFTKQCVSGQCADYSSSNKEDKSNIRMMHNGQALMALYIIFLISAAVCMILYLAKQKTLCNYAGILTLYIAIATMVALIIIVKTTNYGVIKNFDFSSASILMIIACCFMIIKQVMANGIIRSVVKF